MSRIIYHNGSQKSKLIEDRAIEIAEYIVENNATVRQSAKHFGVSKSTAHKDITERLFGINRQLAERVREVLDKNKSERHIRGGLATKQMYDMKRQSLLQRKY